MSYLTETTDRKTFTVPNLRASKARGEKLAMMTAYDYSTAALLEHGGVELALVGDSLGMLVQGARSTLGVSIADTAYHTKAVASACRKTLVIADLPFMSYANAERAFDSCHRVMAAGAQMVKLEGAGPMLEIIAALSARDIPVCAHLGLTPQSMHKLGGFKLQGASAAAADQIYQDAIKAHAAGAELLVLECVPNALAANITAELSIPVIGIGAGPECDGQVLVFQDAMGFAAGIAVRRTPRFVKNFLSGQDSLLAAVQSFVSAVKAGAFPGPEHSYE
jgi:3-methyl-2-oxobutanoate hydroxymethyltransferase